MLDLKITGGTIIDGTGGNSYSADLGIKDGKITDIGSVTEAARQTINADGAIVTPGFVNIHTHYDGQVTWDETLSPSIYHGVRTVVMGNCGVRLAIRAAQMRGIRPIEAIYDYLSEGDGSNLIYFPIFNYATNSLATVWQMLNHPLSLSALSDAGAHVGTICDASFSTSLLAFWTRDRKRGERLTLPQAVE